MLNISLFSALVTVDCGGGILQTGWFFSDDGHLLTAAHGLENNSLIVGDIVSLVRQSDRKKYSARIIELGSSNTRKLDFAILKAEAATHSIFPFLPVITEWSRKFAGTDYYGGGYSDTIGGTPTEINGKVVSHEIRPNDNYIQLSMQTPFKADGLSGCPIITSKGDFTFAIQVAQPKASERMILALPLSCIVKYSQEFRRITAELKRKSHSWDISQLDARLLPTPRKPKSDVKVIYYLYPSDPESHGRRLLEYLQENWKSFCERIRNTRISLGYQLRYTPEFTPKLHFTEVVSSNLDTHFDPSFIGVPVDIEKVRCVCDLSQTVNMNDGEALPGITPVSHLVGVAVGEPGEMLNETRIPNLDCWFSLPTGDARRFAVCMFDIIEDILIDSTLFHSTRILQEFYNTPELKRAFSELKVDFVNTCGLMPYGMSPVNPSLRYVALSSCCRPSFGQPVNYQLLRNVWHSFVNEFALRSLQPREQAATPKLPRELIFQRIVETYKLSGQINRRILRRQLEEFHAEDGELCAVALIKKVAGGKRGKAMKSFFKIQKLRPNRARFCRQSQLSGLLNFQGHLHIFLFRWRRPNLSQEVS